MTVSKFEKLLKKANPKIYIKIRGIGDICAVYVQNGLKSGYIARFSKGELHLNGYRMQVIDTENPIKYKQGNIMKRGRKTLLNLLLNRGVITRAQRSQILWGINS